MCTQRVPEGVSVVSAAVMPPAREGRGREVRWEQASTRSDHTCYLAEPPVPRAFPRRRAPRGQRSAAGLDVVAEPGVGTRVGLPGAA